MKTICMLGWLILAGYSMLNAQLKETRSVSDYHPRTGTLRMKCEAYYDFWSEQEVLHGRFTEWNAKGVPIKECNYAEGKLAGSYTEYFPSGKQKIEGSYADGLPDGSWTYYRRNGQIRKVRNYAAGLKHGKAMAYWLTGQLRRQVEFEHGKRKSAPKPLNDEPNT